MSALALPVVFVSGSLVWLFKRQLSLYVGYSRLAWRRVWRKRNSKTPIILHVSDKKDEEEEEEGEEEESGPPDT